MDKFYKKQTKTVEKALMALKKEIPIPKPFIPAFRKFFHYLYSIGFNEGYYLERTYYNKPIIMRRNGVIVTYFNNITTASEETGFDREDISDNLHGITSEVQGNQFRYYKSKKKGNLSSSPYFFTFLLSVSSFLV